VKEFSDLAVSFLAGHRLTLALLTLLGVAGLVFAVGFLVGRYL
jgi:hypothetical protein